MSPALSCNGKSVLILVDFQRVFEREREGTGLTPLGLGLLDTLFKHIFHAGSRRGARQLKTLMHFLDTLSTDLSKSIWRKGVSRE